MNKHPWYEKRNRDKTLLLVEGHHEKEKLFKLILMCFPEIKIKMEDIIIYKTNIYVLYDKLKREYADEADLWYEADINLPYLIKRDTGEELNARDITNIILIFDYERQDAGFKKHKIVELQKCFNDVNGNGKLYINYPMVESYMHLKTIPDPTYKDLCESVTVGKIYKNKVKNMPVSKLLKLPQNLNETLEERYGISDKTIREQCMDNILKLSVPDNELLDELERIFTEIVDDKSRRTLINQFAFEMKKWRKNGNNISYVAYMREILQQVIIHNLCKASYIQNGIYNIDEEQYIEILEALNPEKIVEKQNEASGEHGEGYIWVLNMSVLFAAEYSPHYFFENIAWNIT